MSEPSRRARWNLFAGAALIASSLACGSTGPSATAKNPPTLTPTIRAATQALVAAPASQTPFQMPDTPSAGDLKIGEHATIHTTAGDRLRIHTRPSYDAPVPFKLADGTRVTIIAGPQVVDADRWWQIETADGQRGWAVESAEGIQTLQTVP